MLEYNLREKFTSRIIAGRRKLKISSSFYWLRPNTKIEIYNSCEIYEEILEEALENGVLSKEEMLDNMISEGLWTKEEEKELDVLAENVDILKMKIFECAFKTKEKELARKTLDITRNRQFELFCKKSSNDYMTAEGQAIYEKQKYLVGCSLLFPDENPVWPKSDYSEDNSGLLKLVVAEEVRTKIAESSIRELSRTDPWRSYWACRESAPIFSAKFDLNEEQRSLILWSKTYDNAYESNDCPSDEVIQDDDAFDGWCLIRRKQREAEMDKNRAESVLSNDKIANAQEVFIITEPEDIDKVEILNDPHTKAVKNQRAKLVEKKGEVQEAEMPDSKQEIYMQFNRMRKQQNG